MSYKLIPKAMQYIVLGYKVALKFLIAKLMTLL